MYPNVRAWQTLSSRYIIQSEYLTVRSDKVLLPNAEIIDDFYVIENPDWINVIAVTLDHHFVMERQFRYGVKKIGLEICAGMIEKDESPINAAKRELFEETGYGGGDWNLFLVSTPNPSSMNNYNYTFLAKGVKKIAKPNLDNTEFIDVELLTKNELKEALIRGDITEGIMQAALWKYFASY